MSSYDQTQTTNASNPNNELQLAPREGSGTEFASVKASFQKCIADQQGFTDQCLQNYRTRYALWPGQSADGKKHSREGSKVDPTPWDGASDLRVYDVDSAVNKKVALYRMAFKKANIIATPIKGTGFRRAKLVSNYMRWLVHTQIPKIDREIELLANYVNEKGVAATGQFWETKQERMFVRLTMQDLQAASPNIDVMALLSDETTRDQIAGKFEEMYGCSAKKASKMCQELLDTGTTSVAAVSEEISRPILRAFNLDEQLFIPPFTTDIERATGIFRVEYYTPEALRAFAHTEGWDEAWVEAAIEKCRGKIITLTPSEYMQPISRSFVYQQQKFTDQIGVVYAYQRLSDEEGVPGIYLTIFNPELPPDANHEGYAKCGLLEYAHGQYPFVLFRREYLSRRLHDSRGIPEPGKSFQDTIKAHRDSRIDAASMSICPPWGFPMGRPMTRWGPGARIPERRPGEYHFMEKLQSDPLTEQSEEILKEGFKDYCGFLTKDGDPQYAQAITQNEIDRFLTGLAEAFTQIYALNGQYGDDKVEFQVMGVKDPAELTYMKEKPNEFYNFYLQFDIQSTDTELMEKRWAAIIQGIQLLNRDGNVNFTNALKTYIESIDPQIADAILDPTAVGQARLVEDEQSDLAQIFAGINKDIRPGTPPQMGLQMMQTYMQAPDVQQRYAQDKAFKQRIDARAKQYQFGASQEQNKLIGRMGALMPGPNMNQVGQPPPPAPAPQQAP